MVRSGRGVLAGDVTAQGAGGSLRAARCDGAAPAKAGGWSRRYLARPIRFNKDGL